MSDTEPNAVTEHPGAPVGERRPLILRRVREKARGTVDTLIGNDLFELGAAMTLVMLVLSLHDAPWQVELGLMTLAILPLVIRPLMHNPFVWLGLTAVLGVATVHAWYGQNNHDFLKLYWCLAVGLSLLLTDPSKALRTNARVLIGLCFLFAFIWKAVSADYVDHSFFNYFLVQDSRFRLLSEFVGGLEHSAILSGQVERVAYTEFGDPTVSLPVPLAASVQWLAPAMTWWTLLIEGAVALLFLCPLRFRLSALRDPALLAFILSTYFVAPILYFAWVLIAMGIIQCSYETFRYWPLGYVAAFMLILMRFYVPI